MEKCINWSKITGLKFTPCLTQKPPADVIYLRHGETETCEAMTEGTSRAATKYEAVGATKQGKRRGGNRGVAQSLRAMTKVSNRCDAIVERKVHH